MNLLTSLPNTVGTKLPNQQLSTAERLRRLEEAIAFLRYLAAGPQPAKTLLQAAYAAGIAERTLHRAKDVLGVTTEHTGWHGESGVGATASRYSGFTSCHFQKLMASWSDRCSWQLGKMHFPGCHRVFGRTPS